MFLALHDSYTIYVVTLCVFFVLGMKGTLTYAVLSLAVMNYCLFIVDCSNL